MCLSERSWILSFHRSNTILRYLDVFQMPVAHPSLLKIKCQSYLLSNFLWVRPDIIQSLGVEQDIHEVDLHASDRNLSSDDVLAHFEDAAEALAVDEFCELLVDLVGVEVELAGWESLFDVLEDGGLLVYVLSLDVSGAPLMGMALHTSDNSDVRCWSLDLFMRILIVDVRWVWVLILHLYFFNLYDF